jgi:hypothetical protein
MPSNPTPDEMRLALAQQNRVAVPNRPGRTMPADQAKLSYAFTHGLAPMLYGAAKGTVASIPGVVGDVNELLRDYAVPYLPTGVQQALAKAPAPFTTEQYINMMPKMGGHTENVATKLGSNVVGTIVDPFAVVGAVKRAPAVARSLAETANNKILQGESLIPGVPAQFVNPPVLPIVKPEKGGNWLTGSIEESVQPLKMKTPEMFHDTPGPITQTEGNFIRYNYPNIDEGYNAYFRGTGQHSMNYGKDTWSWIKANHPEEYKALIEGKTPAHYLNKFVDKKIVPYIKNELATPFDSVRKLAEEKGILHMPLQDNPAVVRDVKRMREQAGFPVEGVAQTPLGRQWETYADEAIGTKSARMMIKQGESESAYDIAKTRLERNPWLRDVDPSTNVYTPLTSEQITSHLKFDHVMDELRNAINPNSELPANLRLKPEALDRVTLPQAIERVAKINEWRSAEAAKAEKAGMLDNLTANARFEIPDAKLSFVEKPGMKWIDIPETAEKSGMDFCTKIGKQGGWCTQGESLAHSYGSGDNRLTALLDAEGRPHVQAMIDSSKYDVSKTHMGDYTDSESALFDQTARNLGDLVAQRGYDQNIVDDVIDYYAAGGSDKSIPAELRKELPALEQQAEAMLPKKELPLADITELKPVGNSFSSDQAKEYARRDPNYQQVVQKSVLDFLNNGNWGKVRDLDYYNVVDLKDTDSVVDTLKSIYGKDMQKGHVLFNEAVDAAPDSSRFMTRGDFINFIEPNVKPEGYKDGGGVSASDSDPSLQFYSRTMDNPDSSKTTEQGIVKQFEQDYMKFALQRHQAPARSDIPNAQPPAARTNIYGEYGTPALGGMVSGRVTKLGHAPDTYMGDLSYRTPVGPGMAHLGVQGMQSLQMPARMTGYQAGYGVPLGGNGFAGVNVMQPAQGGKPVLGAQVQYRKSFAKGGAVRSLESNLPKLPKTDYQSIDELMTEISKRHKTAPKKLHDDFVEKHRMTPDNWIKRK